MRLLNAIEAGTTPGAQLETLLTADPGRLAEFNVLLGMRGHMRRMAASSTAMTAVIASSTAMTAVAASSTAMTAVAASSTAMTAVIASSTAMAAVAASSTAMAAVIASSTAMAAVIASSTAMAAVQSAPAAWAEFKSSTALTAAIIPAMTSNTAPAGVASTDLELGQYAPWMAFDRNSGTFYSSEMPGSGTGHWLQYMFAAPVFIHTFENTPYSASYGSNSVDLKWSDDGVNFTTAASFAGLSTTGIDVRDVKTYGKHKFWRVVCTSARDNGATKEVQLKGFA